jgi:hypothetical protein
MRTLHAHVSPLRDLGPHVHEVRIDVRLFALAGRLLAPSASIIFGSHIPTTGWQPDSPTDHLALTFRGKGFAVLLLDLLAPPRAFEGDVGALRDGSAFGPDFGGGRLAGRRSRAWKTTGRLLDLRRRRSFGRDCRIGAPVFDPSRGSGG